MNSVIAVSVRSIAPGSVVPVMTAMQGLVRPWIVPVFCRVLFATRCRTMSLSASGLEDTLRMLTMLPQLNTGTLGRNKACLKSC
jgi:hypothetical protein